ncbi:MAG TPA: pilus assembly protein PilP [Candidatus Cybelea sp.]|jgi:Tfp pilus assembly protein PilP|nr:pilus assembly protein PilP [Candidatus Cybelea sp.]
MRSAITLVLGILLAAAAPGLLAQANPAAPAGAKPAPPPAGKAAPQSAKPATPAAKRAAKPAADKVAKVPRPAKPVESAVNLEAPKEGEEKGARRDPFESLVARQQAQKNATAALPPGKAGLQVSTLRLDGIVKAPNGMIAVVTNPQARTYFLREGDQLYDGRVEKIAMDGVSFHEIGKDAFGKPVERQVNKRIYSSAGEQQ